MTEDGLGMFPTQNYRILHNKYFIGRYFDCLKLVNDMSGLKIYLQDKNNEKITIKFKYHIMFRYMDEGDALVLANDISEKSENGHVLYEIENSSLLGWVRAQNYGVYSFPNAKHYGIYTSNFVIDVLTYEDMIIIKNRKIFTIQD